MLEIYYACFSNKICDGSIGLIDNKLFWLSFYDDGTKLVKFINEITNNYSKSPLYKLKSTVIKKNTSLLNEYITIINLFFRGELVDFRGISLYYITGNEFSHNVWDSLREIAYGTTRSYKEIAEVIGNPKACRAVGIANKRNLIPLIIPCHRVIKNNGDIGGYSAGIELKKELLAIEKRNLTVL